jgi:hypothetical protein
MQDSSILLAARTVTRKTNPIFELTIENYFQYIPSLGAAIYFAILYGLITIATVVQCVRYKSAYMWVMAMGTACM